MIPTQKVTSKQLQVRISTCWFSGYHWDIHNPGDVISLVTTMSLHYNSDFWFTSFPTAHATFQCTTGIFRKLARVWGETHRHQQRNLQLFCFVHRISARTLSASERFPWFSLVSSHKCRLNLKRFMLQHRTVESTPMADYKGLKKNQPGSYLVWNERLLRHNGGKRKCK
jgi:hypothetical protein